MIYLLYGTEKYLINKELTKIKSENFSDELNIASYDLNTDKLESVIDDALTLSLFNDKKVIIVRNSYIFTGKKLALEQNIDILEKYMDSDISNAIIVFIVDEPRLDERKKIVKSIKKVGVVKDFNKPENLTDLINKMLDNYKMEYQTIQLLINRVGTNLEIISNEIEKIKIYKGNDKIITNQDILDLTSENIESDIFSLIDYIISKDVSNAIKIYRELLKNNLEPIAVIAVLANKIRSIYQAKELYKLGYTENDISSELGIKPGALYYMREHIRKFESKTLTTLLLNLADLDFSIKSGNLIKENALELFILKMN